MDKKRPRDENGTWAADEYRSSPDTTKRFKLEETPSLDASPIPMETPHGKGFFLREDVLAAMMAEVQQHMSTIDRLEAEVTQAQARLDDDRKFFDQQYSALQKQTDLSQSMSQQYVQLNTILTERVTILQEKLKSVEAEREKWKSKATTLLAVQGGFPPSSNPSSQQSNALVLVPLSTLGVDSSPSVVPVSSSRSARGSTTSAHATPHVTYPPSPDRSRSHMTASTSSALSALTTSSDRGRTSAPSACSGTGTGSSRSHLNKKDLQELGPVVHEKRIYFACHSMLTNDDIADFVREGTGITQFDIIRSMFSERSGRALIQCDTTDDARRLLRKHGDLCRGFEANVSLWHQRVPEVPRGARAILATFGDGFPESEEAVRYVFRDCGPIEDVRLMYAMPGNRFQNQATVYFRYELCVARALRLQEAKVKGRPMKVELTRTG